MWALAETGVGTNCTSERVDIVGPYGNIKKKKKIEENWVALMRQPLNQMFSL